MRVILSENQQDMGHLIARDSSAFFQEQKNKQTVGQLIIIHVSHKRITESPPFPEKGRPTGIQIRFIPWKKALMTWLNHSPHCWVLLMVF